MATSDAWPMMPERILADCRIALPDDAYLVTDVGWNKNGVGQQFPIREPGTLLTPGGYATMGFRAARGRLEPSWPHPIGQSCASWATAGSGKTRRCWQRRWNWISTSSGS